MSPHDWMDEAQALPVDDLTESAIREILSGTAPATDAVKIAAAKLALENHPGLADAARAEVRRVLSTGTAPDKLAAARVELATRPEVEEVPELGWVELVNFVSQLEGWVHAQGREIDPRDHAAFEREYLAFGRAHPELAARISARDGRNLARLMGLDPDAE